MIVGADVFFGVLKKRPLKTKAEYCEAVRSSVGRIHPYISFW